MNRKVLALSSVGILAMVGIWYVMLFSPQGSALAQANHRLDMARQKQTELRAQLRALSASKTASATIQAQIDALKLAVPDKASLDTFIDGANGAAAASGVDFVSLAPLPPAVPKGGTLAELHLSMAVTGSYFQVSDFVNRLDALPRLVVVDGLTMAADKSGRISAQINARMFMQGSK